MRHADARSYALPRLFLTLRRAPRSAWSLVRAPGRVTVTVGRWRGVGVWG